MITIFNQLQGLGGQLAPFALLETGFVLAWLGLCLWLGGLRWLKFFAGIIAAAIGYAAACFLTNRELYFLIGIPVLMAFAAILFEKPAMVLLAGVLLALAVNLVLVWPKLNEPANWQNPPEAASPAAGQEITAGQSITILGHYAGWIWTNIYNAAKSLGSVNGAVYGIVILATAALGLIVPRGICALLCSTLGVVMIAWGMFFLLVYKGSKPADIVGANPGMFGLIAAGMIVFGLLVNLAIAPAKAPKKPNPHPVVE